MGRLTNLQILRAISAWFVVTGHSAEALVARTTLSRPVVVNTAWFSGWDRGLTFFTISGFIMVRSTAPEKRSHRDNDRLSS